MVPLLDKVRDWVWKSDDAPHRSLALSHAAHHARPGLWGNDDQHPTSVVWLREGDENGWEAFAAGVPGPVLDWLATPCQGRPITLLAPPSWEEAVRARSGIVESISVQTWINCELSIPTRPERVEFRRLGLDDEAAFRRTAPSWALRSWGDYATLIGQGVALGVPTLDGFASLAWTYESDTTHEKVGVTTFPRYRRLGLGRRVAWPLLQEIIHDRQKQPVWVTTPANTASIALARALGFSTQVTETLLRWTFARD